MTFTHLSDSLAKQPQQLLIPKSSSSALRDEPGRIVQHELEPARTPGHVRTWSLIASSEMPPWPLPAVSLMYGAVGEEDIERRVT
jgi:hypothetical protein